jgi:hypothetical protein
MRARHTDSPRPQKTYVPGKSEAAVLEPEREARRAERARAQGERELGAPVAGIRRGAHGVIGDWRLVGSLFGERENATFG